MTPLRQQMHDAMLVRGLAERTRQAYIKSVARLAIYYDENPANLAPEQVEAWLLHLIRDRKLSYSTLNQAASACRFFYGTVLNRERSVFPVPMAQTPQRQPKNWRGPNWWPCSPALLHSSPELCYRLLMRQVCVYRKSAPCELMTSTAIQTGCACGFVMAKVGKIAIHCCRQPCWKPYATIGVPTILRSGCFRAGTALIRSLMLVHTFTITRRVARQR